MEARARRALAGVGLAAALIAAAGVFYLRPWLAFAPAHAALRPPARASVAVQRVEFVSATTGWVVTGGASASSLFRTTDGGRHWQRQFRGVNGTGWTLSFFDARRGVIVASDQRGPVLLRTADGGQHWTTRRLATCITQPQLVFFLDADHGWCVAPNGDQTGGVPQLVPDRQQISLYRTTDGGATWTRVLATTPALPVAMGLGDEGQKAWIWFADASDGWIGQFGAGHAVVYATTDAGDHWSRQELSPPDGGWGSAVGILEDTPPPRGSGTSPSVVVATLENGPRQGTFNVDGRYVYTWQAPAWRGPVQVPSGPVTLADQAHWFVVMGTSVLESSDGGENWTATLGVPPSGWVIAGLTMVDLDNGWATLLRLPPSLSPVTTTGLARTADAGVHWTEVTPPS